VLCALPCYSVAVTARVPVPTPDSLREHLSAAGSKDRFGSSAAEVLALAQQVAAADSDWDKGTIASFQKDQKIHPKVWGKLVAIAKSKNLKGLPEENLPASYTALYALVVMKADELKAAQEEKVIGPNASSRAILDWTKAYRLRSTGIEQEIPITLVLREDLTPQEHQDLLSALKETAERFGAEVREGKGGVKQAEVKAEARKALATQIEEELMREIGEVVASAPEDLKTRFGIRTAADLIDGPRATFTGFFQNLEGKVEGAFWRKHGRAYCLRIARDFNLTESRADRYQFKKRLEDAAKKWEETIEGFEEMVQKVFQTYMSR
jgi:hypothetical protein